MIRKLILWVICPWLSMCCVTGQIPLNAGPASMALSGCDVALAGEKSVVGNPARLANVQYPVTSLFYENRYGVAELSSKGLFGYMPSSFGTIGALVSQFGFKSFLSSRYAVSYSKAFGTKVSAGMQFNLADEFLSGAGHFSAFFTNVGLCYSPTKQLTVGVHCYNPEQSVVHYPNFDVPLPTFFEAGINWHLLSHTHVVAELEQLLGGELQLAVGLESSYNQILFLRGGYRLTSGRVSWGVGTRWHRIGFDAGFAWQMPIGMMSSVSLMYVFKK